MSHASRMHAYGSRSCHKYYYKILFFEWQTRLFNFILILMLSWQVFFFFYSGKLFSHANSHAMICNRTNQFIIQIKYYIIFRFIVGSMCSKRHLKQVQFLVEIYNCMYRHCNECLPLAWRHFSIWFMRFYWFIIRLLRRSAYCTFLIQADIVLYYWNENQLENFHIDQFVSCHRPNNRPTTIHRQYIDRNIIMFSSTFPFQTICFESSKSSSNQRVFLLLFCVPAQRVFGRSSSIYSHLMWLITLFGLVSRWKLNLKAPRLMFKNKCSHQFFHTKIVR